MKALVLALLSLAPAPAPSRPDEIDDQYHFVAGLYDKGMHELVVKEAEAFLRDHGRHERAPMVRYRLGLSLFELDRTDDAAPHFSALARASGFQYRSEAWMRLAQCQLAAGDLSSAEASLGQVLDSGADYLHTVASFLLAETQFQRGDFAAAARGYGRVLDSGDADYAERARFGLAWSAFRLRDFEATLEHARGFRSRHGESELAGEVSFLEGEALLELGRPREALDAYGRVGSGPQSDGALRGAAFAHAALGDHGRAARVFGQLLERFPDSRYAAEAAFHRGVQLFQSGDVAGARAALSAGGLPDTAEVLYWRAQAEAKDGDPRAARQSLERALASDPGEDWSPRIHSLLGDVLAELGEAGGALAAYSAAGSDYALHAAAVSSINAGRADEAVRLASSLIAEYPDSDYRAEALLTLGEGLFQLESYAESEDAFRRAAQDVEGDERARAESRVAWCRYFQGDRETAGRLFEAVHRDHPQAPEAAEALFMAGRARQEAGDAGAAARSWTRYLETHRDGDHRSDVLLELARMQPGIDGAAFLEELLREDPDGELAPEARYQLAERLSQAGRSDEARRRYREVLERHSGRALAGPALYGLAWCHYEAGDYAAAAENLRAFSQLGQGDPELRLSGLELLVFSECRAKRPQAALGPYRRFAELCGDDERTFRTARLLAGALREAGHPEEAETILEDCLARVRDTGVVAGALVEGVFLSLERGDVEDAEARARVAQRRAPEDPAVAEALFFVGEAAFDAKRNEKAAELYALAGAVGPSPVADRALYKEGFARLRLDDANGAAQCFGRLVTEHPGSDLFGESLFLAAESLFRTDRLEPALEYLKRLRREAPRHETMPKALFRGGVALCRLERYDEANQWLSELSRRHEDFENGAEAELWRGRALAGAGDGRGARLAFERVIARDRGALAARARIELGRMRLEAGDLEAALSEFLKVAVLYAHGEEVAESLWLAGQCLERLGDGDRAAEQYREILAEHDRTSFASLARERLSQL